MTAPAFIRPSTVTKTRVAGRRTLFIVEIGDTYNFLTVVGAPLSDDKKRRWLCRCECGTEKRFRACEFASGHTKSCGCYARSGDANRGHGHGTAAKTRTYQTWQHMIRRCCVPSCESYATYGAKGITVCEQWRESFQAFLDDMGERPEGKTLDRFPNREGNYEPGNCRWATPAEQVQNSSKAKLTVELVREIRSVKGSISARKAGPVYGVSPKTIGSIWRGETWRNA